VRTTSIEAPQLVGMQVQAMLIVTASARVPQAGD